MAFTPEQETAISAKLTELVGDAQCPMCKHPNFHIAPEITFMPLRGGLSAVSMPCLVLLCARCGTAQFVSVFGVGLQDVLGIKPMSPEITQPKTEGK